MMTKRNRFQCSDPTCKKYFSTETKRAMHIRLIHKQDTSEILEAEKPYKCDFDGCVYSTHSGRGLKQHKTMMDHGSEPSRSTVFKRAADARKAEGVNDDDVRGALAKAIQENIRLNKELERMERDRTIVAKSPPIIAQDLYDDMVKLLQGNPYGATEEEKLGLVACYDKAMETNEKLRADLELARTGLIPDQWLTDIKTDLYTSVGMIITAMQESVKDRSKIDKYDKMLKMFTGGTNE